tara:strand:+ start:343 stop:540 length:198 start_codon:yes stop_codon:yes gene_type:complete
MKRFFTNRQRKILRILSGNLCGLCGVKLSKDFHADHIIPFSRSGKTILKNGWALCPKCNLKKGNK